MNEQKKLFESYVWLLSMATFANEESEMLLLSFMANSTGKNCSKSMLKKRRRTQGVKQEGSISKRRYRALSVT